MALINQELNGYTFLEFIGSGSFGSVYKAVKDRNTYAIKVFREDYILQEYRKHGADNRIQREIDIMKSVNSPFLIKYVDDFKAVDLNVPSYFLVMEYASGKTLQKVLADNDLRSDKDILSVFRNILIGIKALHQVRGEDDSKGVIHRDLKPENIIVSDNHDVKILDYGISKIIDFTALTSTGNFLGSPVYASPEQITDSKNIDKRSDLYTLGVILYEMLTKHLPYDFSNFPDLIDKIKNVSPVPPRKYRPDIKNLHENIILRLLEKHPFERYTSIDDLIGVVDDEVTSPIVKHDLSPRFVLRLWNEATVLTEYLKTTSSVMHVEFPAIHQFRQKSLLNLIQGPQFKKMIDPETVRFAYDTYSDRQGLKMLPYCPPEFKVITPSYLKSYKSQKDYVKLVIDEEAKLGTDIFVSPYHYTHNTTILPTYKQNPVEQWFDLDVKLLKESIEYKNSVSEYANKEIYAGICINASSLTDEGYKNDLLNNYTAHGCDGYIVYADGIDKTSNATVLFNYVDTLLKLQSSSGRPVIAGRLNSLGLGLISLGIAGFSSGAARFESFSEDLHKEPSEAFNLYERYYFPQLLGTVSVERRRPTRLHQVSQVLGACKCQFCNGKSATEVIASQNNKLHFLGWMELELATLVAKTDKLEYFLGRINYAISSYMKLGAVYKKEEYKHLEVWSKVFTNYKSQHVPV